MRSMQEDLFTELDYEQGLGEESEDGQMVSLNRLLEKHRDISLNGLLEKHRDEEVIFMPICVFLIPISIVSRINLCFCRCKNRARWKSMAKKMKRSTLYHLNSPFKR
jgi:hypothetical protein